MTLGARRRLGLALVVLVCAMCGCLFSTGTARAAEPIVPTVSCHTSYGVRGPYPKIPARIAVRDNPKSVRGLVAYSDPYAHIVGPAGMQCSALSGADGSQNITVWPKGQREPRAHSDGEGLNLEEVPACVGCMYSLVCPLDKSLANKIYPGYPVACAAAPKKEQIERRGDLLLFIDPPGVAGDAFPSGGQHTAYGAVGWTRRKGAFEASCTLPGNKKSICTVRLNDAITVLY
jgi:hypothetical protein